MTETDALGRRQTRLLWILGGPLFASTADFVLLVITYLVVGRIAPGMLGAAAERPVTFAFWVTLVALPVRIIWVALSSGRAPVTGPDPGDSPEEASRIRRRRFRITVRAVTTDVVILAAAVLFVANIVLDPGDAPLRQLAAVTALAPLIVVQAIHGLYRLAGWLLVRRNA